MSPITPPPLAGTHPARALPFSRWTAATMVLLGWIFGGLACAMWGERFWPAVSLVMAPLGVLLLLAGASMALGRMAALSTTDEGLRVNLRLRRWEDIEAMERGGTTACPSLKVRMRARRWRVGHLGQEGVRGDLLAFVDQLGAERRIPVVGEPEASRRRRTNGFVLAAPFTMLLVLADLQFLPGLWVRGPGRTVDALDRLRPGAGLQGGGEITVLSTRDQTATVLDLVRFLSGREGVSVRWYNPFDPPRQPATDGASALSSAMAAGTACAGADVQVRGGEAEVLRVVPGSPAAGLLHAGERILSVGGSAVRYKEDVFAALVGWDLSRPAPVVVEDNDGHRRTVTLRVERGLYGSWRLAGVHIDRRPMAVEGVRRTFDDHGFQGDSAGLAAALAVFDAETPGLLVPPGSKVAVTGSVSPSGVVGPVGGVPEKMAAARKAGARAVLVPAELAERAAHSAGAGLRVVGVGTLDEALRFLGTGGCL